MLELFIFAVVAIFGIVQFRKRGEYKADLQDANDRISGMRLDAKANSLELEASQYMLSSVAEAAQQMHSHVENLVDALPASQLKKINKKLEKNDLVVLREVDEETGKRYNELQIIEPAVEDCEEGCDEVCED